MRALGAFLGFQVAFVVTLLLWATHSPGEVADVQVDAGDPVVLSFEDEYGYLGAVPLELLQRAPARTRFCFDGNTCQSYVLKMGDGGVMFHRAGMGPP